MELSLNTIQRAERLVAGNCCSNDLAASYALQFSLTHQPLHCAFDYLDAFSPELHPDLHCTTALHVGVPFALDFRNQHVIAPSTAAR